jgi:hypothetical protein
MAYNALIRFNKWKNRFQLNAIYFTNKEKRILEMAKAMQNLQYLALHKGEFSLPTTEVWHSLLIRISISSHLRTYSKHICAFTVYVFIVHQLDSIHVVGRIS